MRKFTSIDTVSLLIAIATYLMVGPSIAYFSAEIFNKFSGESFNLLSLIGLLPLIGVFFLYKYAYQKQMNLLSSDRVRILFENQRKNMLDNGVFLFHSKETVEKKYYPDTDAFARSLIPVAVIILAIVFFMFSRSSFSFSVADFKDFETLSFYAGLILVMVNFYPKSKAL